MSVVPHQPQVLVAALHLRLSPTCKALPVGPWTWWGWWHMLLCLRSCVRQAGVTFDLLTNCLYFLSQYFLSLIFMFAPIPGVWICISTSRVRFYLILADRMNCYFLSIEMSTYLILSKYFITHEIILASNKFWYSLHHGCNTDTGLGHFCEGLLFPLEQKCPDMKVLGVLCVFLPWREIAVKQVFFCCSCFVFNFRVSVL